MLIRPVLLDKITKQVKHSLECVYLLTRSHESKGRERGVREIEERAKREERERRDRERERGER